MDRRQPRTLPARPAAPPSEGSYAYATALAAFALRSANPPALERARQWLASHQSKSTGALTAPSMNKVYPAGSHQEQFMSEAATAFAALALEP